MIYRRTIKLFNNIIEKLKPINRNKCFATQIMFSFNLNEFAHFSNAQKKVD